MEHGAWRNTAGRGQPEKTEDRRRRTDNFEFRIANFEILTPCSMPHAPCFITTGHEPGTTYSARPVALSYPLIYDSQASMILKVYG
jgi:hypothetical protein